MYRCQFSVVVHVRCADVSGDVTFNQLQYQLHKLSISYYYTSRRDKPVFGVSHKAKLKPVSSSTETS